MPIVPIPANVNQAFLLQKGSRALDPMAKREIQTYGARSSVYAIVRAKMVQYVGESEIFSTRFAKGLSTIGDYVWADTPGKYVLYVWQVSDFLREAVEMELTLRVRLASGLWPVDMRSVGMVHPFRSDRSIGDSSTLAAGMFHWLLAQDPDIADDAAKDLLEHFENVESIRLRGERLDGSR